ncbi:carbon storage regulator [Conexibacter sp. JD483]|uniref:carbon storage regulator n=1 Tax=unclassified Conexibacter TaxID=2627773 RepID=UPI0027158591|nr:MULTISPECIES: carbon storage regulator [unclassified Conexibacter]MDO8185845.1 carbon storage regulator [Conexibacter sp. CPCC 205706]MDR9367675.1 carbon storage regulator [Conexibacter sp. JD483]
MLVLTRRPGETIEIGNGIRITLISAGNGRARLGTTAPRDVEIVRGELAAGWSRRTRQPLERDQVA